MRFALLLIDLQNDYLARPGLVPAADQLIATSQRLLAGCRHLGVPVFRVETRVRADDSNRMPHWRRMQRRDCLEGSAGAQAPAELALAAGEESFAKPFFNAFDVAEFEAALGAQAIDTLVVAGLYTHACVRDTVLAAYSRGYRVWIAADAISSPEPEHARLSLEFLAARAATLLPSDELLRLIGDALSSAASLPSRVWRHRDPCDHQATLFEIPVVEGPAVATVVAQLRARAEQWRGCAAETRLAGLRRWGDVLAGQRRALVDLLVSDVAKPLPDAEAEFDYALSLLRHTIDHPATDEAVASGVGVQHCPLGVIGLITPWNNPLAIPVGKLAPAIGFGNAVVWKPAPAGSRIAACLAATLATAGCGEVVTVLTGDAETGRRLASASGIDALSFTGSVAVGQQLAKICAAFGTRFQGELGGNNPVLILDDIDPQPVARELALAMFSFSGQRCTAPRRLLVAEAIKEAFVAALHDAVARLTLGRPATAGVHIGPLISPEAQQRMLDLVAAGIAEGGRILCGGGIPPAFREGCWFEPTVVVDPEPNGRVVREESFGPVVVLLGIRDLAHGIALCNSVPQGLVATIYTGDTQAQQRFAAEVEAGMVGINQARPRFAAAAPFFGWKDSAIGLPEHGRWDRDFYTRTKAIYDAV
jgi:acyl-CoA reductase-like NAD-dependent aldehyde dehydrogenase/nicotinamidase-related amidase